MNLQQRDLRVIISGGGTGGHIFPAIAIANALKKRNPANEILFVGALGRMEMEKVPAAGYRIVGLNISGIQRKKILKNLLLPFRLIGSILKARKIIKNFSPDVAVGVGGYASGPLLYVASAMNVPGLIQEQNSYAGITNKILSKKVRSVCVAYEGMERFFPKEKLVMTGNPVRDEVIHLDGKKEEAMKLFGLKENKKTILVIGGSLGARTINDSISAGLKEIHEKGIQLIWQTGKTFGHVAKQNVEKYKADGFTATEFIHRMDLAYAAADIVVSRSGAGSVSELSLIAKPVILVPSPNVAEDHQTKNAMALVDHHATILVHDKDARTTLVKKILELAIDAELQKQLSENISKLAIRDSADKIVDEIYRIVN